MDVNGETLHGWVPGGFQWVSSCSIIYRPIDLSTYPPTDGPTTQDVKILAEMRGKKLRSIFDKYDIP